MSRSDVFVLRLTTLHKGNINKTGEIIDELISDLLSRTWSLLPVQLSLSFLNQTKLTLHLLAQNKPAATKVAQLLHVLRINSSITM